jgi:hypothetical protein
MAASEYSWKVVLKETRLTEGCSAAEEKEEIVVLASSPSSWNFLPLNRYKYSSPQPVFKHPPSFKISGC